MREPPVASVMDAMTGMSAEHTLTSKVTAAPVVFCDRERLALVIRNLIEIAFRRARTATDVVLFLDEVDAYARIGVRYDVVPAAPSRADAGYSGLRLEQDVMEALAKASCGTLRSKQDDEGHCVDRIEIPTVADL